jgi:hypothetical protein
MPTIAPETDLLSLGKLCELLQASPSQLERACARTGTRPALRLNGVPYYTDAALAVIGRQLAQKSRRTQP